MAETEQDPAPHRLCHTLEEKSDTVVSCVCRWVNQDRVSGHGPLAHSLKPGGPSLLRPRSRNSVTPEVPAKQGLSPLQRRFTLPTAENKSPDRIPHPTVMTSSHTPHPPWSRPHHRCDQHGPRTCPSLGRHARYSYFQTALLQAAAAAAAAAFQPY